MNTNCPAHPTHPTYIVGVAAHWIAPCQFGPRRRVVRGLFFRLGWRPAKCAAAGLFLGIVATLVLTGCTNNVVVTGSVPTPLVKKIPARLGIYYSQSFQTFQHEEKIPQQGEWKVELGAQNLGFFRNLMGAMFASITEVSEPPLPTALQSGLDGVLIPEILKYGFLTPSISGLNFYSASIHYRLTLLDARGEKVAEWTVVGYGKSEAAVFGENAALAEATMLAIRDGGARIAVDLVKQQGVAQWLAALPGTAATAPSQPAVRPIESSEKS